MTLPAWLRVFTDNTEADWKLVRFQPLIMAALFIGGIILAGAELDHSTSPHFAQDFALGLPHIVWIAMLIGAPLTFIVTSAMINKGSHVSRTRTWGLGLRLAADVIAATAVCSYVVTRLIVETYVMSGSLLVASALFTLLIVWRDFRVMVLDRRSKAT